MPNPAQARRLKVERLGREGCVEELKARREAAWTGGYSASYRAEIARALRVAERVRWDRVANLGTINEGSTTA